MRAVPSLYRPRLLWLFIITGMLSACQPAQESAATSSADSAPVASIAHASAQVATAGTNARLPQALDWTKIDSGVTAVDKNTFDYPFALDSKPMPMRTTLMPTARAITSPWAWQSMRCWIKCLTKSVRRMFRMSLPQAKPVNLSSTPHRVLSQVGIPMCLLSHLRMG